MAGAGGKIKVLIVDDSALVRQLLTQILGADASIEVVGAAQDAYVAREKIKSLTRTSSRSTSRCRRWTASSSCGT